MSDAPTARGGTIVVGIDGSAGANEALRWAVDEASVRSAGLEIVYAWEVPTGAAVYAVPDLGYEDLAREIVDQAAGEARRQTDPARPIEISAVAIGGPAAPTLIESSRHADLLVVGSRGHGSFTGLLLGSVGLHCASHAACPVVIVRPAESGTG